MQSNILCNILPSIVFRNSIRHYAKHIKKLQNPGLQKRINLLSDKNERNNFNETDFEELESDFMGAGKALKLHKHEIEALREKEKFWIVRRKYFKEKKINFLTWNDKEQIKYLYNTNPEEWTIEKLSEGFPALPETISKIIRTKWQPKNDQRKKNHDLHVENNWKLFKDGKLSDLPKELTDHVSKFTNRKPRMDLVEEKTIFKKTSTQKTGEFASIVKNYKKLVEEKSNMEQNVEPPLEIESEKFNWETNSEVGQRKSNRQITLSELKNKISKNIDSGKQVNEYEKIILKGTNQLEESIVPHSNEKSNEVAVEKQINHDFKISGLSTYKVEMNNKVATNEDKKALESLKYPERIVIPKEKYKEGYTYKVNDCYYDDDGEFLYRVPGMY